MKFQLSTSLISFTVMSALLASGCEKTEAAMHEDTSSAPPSQTASAPQEIHVQTQSSTSEPAAQIIQTATPKTSTPQTQRATRTNGKTGFPVQRCMNLGNALEAEYEGAWGYTIRRKDFRILKQAGFDTVRIPIRWSDHAKHRPPYTIDAPFMARVQTLVSQAQAQGLGVILDIHHYNEMMQQPARHQARFVGLWDQIATAFANAPANVYFEMVNEPMGNMDVRSMNALYAKTLPVIRRTNPTRKVIIGGDHWNYLEGMNNVDWPEDANLIATFHHYDPHKFTHQGAQWEASPPPLGTKWGRRKDIRQMHKNFAYAKAFSQKTGLHVFVGEFGVINNVPTAERNAWTKAQRQAMETNGFSWCAWDFSGAFNTYDIKSERWLPGVLDALTDR